MSNPLKSVVRVFKGVAKVAKKLAPIALPAAAMFFGGGLAAGAFAAPGTVAAGGATAAASTIAPSTGLLGGATGEMFAGALAAPAAAAPSGILSTVAPSFMPQPSGGGILSNLGITGGDALQAGGGLLRGIGDSMEAEKDRDFYALEREKDRRERDVDYDGLPDPYTPTYTATIGT